MKRKNRQKRQWSSLHNNFDANKRACDPQPPPSSILLVYPFFMPILLLYLEDFDVLQRLLLTDNSMKYALTNYAVKSALIPQVALRITQPDRYLSIKIIKLCYVEDHDLHAFPSLEEVEFASDYEFDNPIMVDIFPRSLKRITFPHVFDQNLDPDILPPELQYLDLKSFDGHIAPGVIPHSVTELIGNHFNQPLNPGVLPALLTKLDLSKFDHPFAPGVLPPSLTELRLGEFNQAFEVNSLPFSLKVLHLPYFKKPLDEAIMPPCLKNMYLSYGFTGPLFLPHTLTTLTLEKSLRDVKITNLFPPSLTELDLGCDMFHSPPLSPGLLPNTIVKLTVRQPILPGTIPTSVIDLTYECNEMVPVGTIPDSVKTLSFQDLYNQRILPGMIPPSVTHLTLSPRFNQFLQHGSLPQSITHLIFGSEFNQFIVPGSLPNSLVLLIFGSGYNKPLMPGALPSVLTHLSFDREHGRFNQMLLTMPQVCPWICNCGHCTAYRDH